MIEIKNVTKRYGSFTAIEDITFTVETGMVYGLVGYNGAGKTTLLKTAAGVYTPDEGSILVDGIDVHASVTPVTAPFIVADEPYFLSQATPHSMRTFYRGYYPNWSDVVFGRLLELFELYPKRKLAGFSKGMQRQVALILGLASGARTLFLDESFDGLDLSKRILLKRLLVSYAARRDASVILSSHNLREIEDVAARLGMIEGKALLFDESVDDLHSRYENATLEEVFLREGGFEDVDIDRVFD